MQGNVKSVIKVAVFSGWGILVLWYFSRSFPFVNLSEILLNGAMLLILLLFFTALGKRVFRTFHLAFASFTEECCFSCGLGTGITIFLIFGLAASGILYELVIVVLIFTLYAFVYQDARAICMTGYRIGSDFFLRKKSFIEMICLILLGFAGTITFVAAATPPYFYDALVYHLAVPQQYLLKHGFQYMPHHHFSNFPMNLGMLFLVGMSFSGGILAKLISWSFAPLTALAVYGFSKPRWGSRIAILAAVFCFFVPGILILSILTSVDLGVMFYSFLSFSALVSWFSSRQKSWFLLSAIFCSLAVGTKYTAIPMTFLPLVLVLCIHEYFIRRCGFVHALKKIFLISVIVFLGVSPWLAKNIVYTGNPTYPLFNWLFGTHVSHQYNRYDQEILEEKSLSGLLLPRSGENKSLGKTFLETIMRFLKSPWTVTMKTSRVAGKTGVVFLLCLPGIFLVNKMDTTSRYLLALAGCSFALWIFFLPDRALRYVFQIFPLLNIVISYILWNIPISEKGKKLLVGGISLLLLYHLSLFFAVANTVKPFSYLLNNLSKEAFLLQSGTRYYPIIEFINRETPKESKILFVWEIRGYYCERDYLIATNTPYDKNAIILRQVIVASQNIEEVLEKLYDLGITHILLNLSEMRRIMGDDSPQDLSFDFEIEKDRQIFQALFSPQYLRLLITQNQVYLYQLLYPGRKT